MTARADLFIRTALLSIALGSTATVLADAGPVVGGQIDSQRPLVPAALDGAKVAQQLRRPGRRGLPPILIVDQTEPDNGAWTASQLFTDDPAFDSFAFDEFTVHQDWLLDQLIVFGTETGDPLCNQDVVAEIWQGRPGDGGLAIMQVFGNQVGDDLIFNFGGQSLPPGDYLITAFVVRPFDDGLCLGGQWGWQQTDQLYGFEHGFWNPGEGFGVGGDIGKASDIAFPTAAPSDLRFQLYAFPQVFIDCNANGMDDFIDLSDGTSFDTNSNGIPDECERDGLGGSIPDFDLDGIPNLADSKPSVYSHVEPGAAVTAPFLAQLSFPLTDYSEAANDTEHGAITVSYPTEPTVYLYINIEVDGVWVVQNRLVYTEELLAETPEQSSTFFFDLGVPRGVVVPSANIRYWVDPIGFDTLPPVETWTIFYPTLVSPEIYRIGYMTGAPDPVPVPAPENPTSPAPMPKVVKTTKTNDNFEVDDLDRNWERNSCAPNAVGSSLHWLNKTYDLGLTKNLKQLVQEFRRLMGTLNGKGTTLKKKLEAKKGFIRKHKLPLTVESHGIPLDLDDTATPEDLFRELGQGQDVEIGYGFYKLDPMNKWKRSGGHTVAIKSITKCVKDGVTTWTITFRHDWRQGAAGGVADVPVKITAETKDFDNDGTNETVWVLDNGPFGAKDKTRIVEEFTSESPTVAQLNKLLEKALVEYGAAADAAWLGGVTLPEAQEALKKAQALKKTWQRFLDNVKLLVPARPELVNSGTRGLKSACNIRDSWAKRVKAEGGKGANKSVLPADFQAMSDLEIASMLTADLPQIAADLPPDADFDDIEDALDNAPLEANNDQADEDGNLIPDVSELGPITDCNDNGLIDDFEVTIFDVVDYNFDGTANLGFIYDLDGNGIPDDCDTPPVECVADIDGDFDTDIFDFAIFAPNFGTSGHAPFTNGDLDGDGDIDIFDFAIFAPEFGCVPSP